MKEITKAERKRMIAGIAEYKYEQEVIKRVLRKHTRLSSREFDRIFWDSKFIITKTGEKIEVRRRPRFRFMGSKGGSFILGDVFSISDWSKWLQLTHIMWGLGIVHLEGSLQGPKEIYYSLKEKA